MADVETASLHVPQADDASADDASTATTIAGSKLHLTNMDSPFDVKNSLWGSSKAACAADELAAVTRMMSTFEEARRVALQRASTQAPFNLHLDTGKGKHTCQFMHGHQVFGMSAGFHFIRTADGSEFESLLDVAVHYFEQDGATWKVDCAWDAWSLFTLDDGRVARRALLEMVNIDGSSVLER